MFKKIIIGLSLGLVCLSVFAQPKVNTYSVVTDTFSIRGSSENLIDQTYGTTIATKEYVDSTKVVGDSVTTIVIQEAIADSLVVMREELEDTAGSIRSELNNYLPLNFDQDYTLDGDGRNYQFIIDSMNSISFQNFGILDFSNDNGSESAGFIMEDGGVYLNSSTIATSDESGIDITSNNLNLYSERLSPQDRTEVNIEPDSISFYVWSTLLSKSAQSMYLSDSEISFNKGMDAVPQFKIYGNTPDTGNVFLNLSLEEGIGEVRGTLDFQRGQTGSFPFSGVSENSWDFNDVYFNINATQVGSSAVQGLILGNEGYEGSDYVGLYYYGDGVTDTDTSYIGFDRVDGYLKLYHNLSNQEYQFTVADDYVVETITDNSSLIKYTNFKGPSNNTRIMYSLLTNRRSTITHETNKIELATYRQNGDTIGITLDTISINLKYDFGETVGLEIGYNSGTGESYLTVYDGFTGKGLTGADDFSANYEDNSYVQKTYVDARFDSLNVIIDTAQGDFYVEDELTIKKTKFITSHDTLTTANDTLDFSTYSVFDVVLEGSCDSLSFKNATAGTYLLNIKNTGAYTINFNDDQFKISGGSEDITSGSNEITIVSCAIREDETGVAYCTISKDFE